MKLFRKKKLPPRWGGFLFGPSRVLSATLKISEREYQSPLALAPYFSIRYPGIVARNAFNKSFAALVPQTAGELKHVAQTN